MQTCHILYSLVAMGFEVTAGVPIWRTLIYRLLCSLKVFVILWLNVFPSGLDSTGLRTYMCVLLNGSVYSNLYSFLFSEVVMSFYGRPSSQSTSSSGAAGTTPLRVKPTAPQLVLPPPPQPSKKLSMIDSSAVSTSPNNSGVDLLSGEPIINTRNQPTVTTITPVTSP